MKPGFEFVISLLVSLFVFSGSVRNASAADALQPLKIIEGLHIEKISSIEEMAMAVEKLKTATATALKQDRFAFQHQALVLSKSGACIERLIALMEGENADSLKKGGGALLGDIRLLLIDIQSINQKAISKLEEVRLESIKEPVAFFKSDAWKTPHALVSLSGYWLGWTGYYTGMLLTDNDPAKKNGLEEAIRFFSFAFPDLNENILIAKTLLGRALCYKELKAYDKATADLISAKSKLRKEDDLFFKCLFEEAAIRYQTGELDQALRILDSFFESFSDTKIPEIAEVEGNRLRAKILMTLLEKSKPDSNGSMDTTDTMAVFDRFKNMADSNKRLGIEFYHYVKAHTAELEKLSYEALGAWGSAAMGDYLFGEKKYTEAMGYYLHLNATPEALPEDLLDDIWFRLADIYCKQERWPEAIEILEVFAKRFPEASQIGEAARLYYTAALNAYTADTNDQSYAKYIDAAKTYVAHCQGCPELSEAHFQLGKYYQKKAQLEKSMLEYSQVGPDSPHFSIALYPLLEDMVEQLGHLQRQEQGRSEKAMKIYTEGIKLVTELQSLPPGKEAEGLGKSQAAHLNILQAEFYGYGPKSTAKETLNCLDGFEQRYPDEKKFILTAKMLRIDAYYSLGMLKEAQIEIAGVMPDGRIDADQFAFLQELATRLHRSSTSHRETKEKKISEHQSATAHAIYEKLFRISENDPAYRNEGDPLQHRMAEMYMNEDKFEKAREIYEEILRKNPQSASATYNLGAIYEKNGQWTEAFDNWQRFSEKVEVGSYHWYESRYRSAKASVELGNKDRACEIIKTTFTLHPEKGDDNLVNKLQVMRMEICMGN
ncbi:MAG: tetratricopeptide repeat protein [Pseudomonadota bacterium]